LLDEIKILLSKKENYFVARKLIFLQKMFMCSYKITNAESFLQGGLGFKISCFLKKVVCKGKKIQFINFGMSQLLIYALKR
jgi:hypothetical protein